MRRDAPIVLVHQYIQNMMAWLLFVEDLSSVSSRQALQLGLGAGSLTKFCYHQLGMKTCAIEINPQVVIACRSWFKLPQDNPRLQVVLADAGEEIRQMRWQGVVDALQVDLYDQEAAAPVLDSEAFYADCRKVLTDDGCMSVNLFGNQSSFERSVDKMAAAFGRDALWAFKATREGNTVVLAQRNPTRPPRALLQERAATIARNWGLASEKWPRLCNPLTP